MIKSIRSLPAMICLLIVLMLECAIAEGPFEYRVLPKEEAQTSQYEAEQIALSFMADEKPIQIHSTPLSSDTLELGHLILYSHYINLKETNGVLRKAWFISFLDCSNAEPSWDPWVAAVVVDDCTQEVIYHTEDYFEIVNYLVKPYKDDYFDWYHFDAGIVHNICYPRNFFGRVMIPDENDMSEEEAIRMAAEAVLAIDGNQIEEGRFKTYSTLTRYEGLCSENVWVVSFHDLWCKYPAVPAYKCAIYSNHGELWFLGKQEEDKVFEPNTPYKFIYINNRYCMNPIDLTFIPMYRFRYLQFDEIFPSDYLS